MARALSDTALTQFRNDGYFFPVPVLSQTLVADLRNQLETFEAAQGGALRPEQRNKSHLLFKWLDDLIRDPCVVDPIEDILGPNILCWNTLLWIKEAHAPSFVSWHQDITYWGLAGGEVVSAWLALSPATLESGCMRVLPGSHIGDIMQHEDRYADSNMLTRGQEIVEKIEDSATVAMPLSPGEMSLHNVRLAHASGPNVSDDRRIGVSMHFIPTSAYQSVVGWDSAALVRGTDSHRNFHHTPQPVRDLDPDAVEFHRKAAGVVRDILYHGAEHKTGRL
ncbi:MAG: phytanoyl-CoA dioxygenase family protein [Alphaproteobacteria bacterium]|nr:phytanoyl-CoA dioxygenase family protein [Alphaproteobacteria bacterium]